MADEEYQLPQWPMVKDTRIFIQIEFKKDMNMYDSILLQSLYRDKIINDEFQVTSIYVPGAADPRVDEMKQKLIDFINKL